jgi:hypothetical protein
LTLDTNRTAASTSPTRVREESGSAISL